MDTLGITQKLDRVGGDASQTKVVFNDKESVEEVKSGSTIAKLFGGIKKWLDDIKTKLDGIAEGANKYIHPVHSAKEGFPDADQTPGFGNTFSISQVVSDEQGHISRKSSAKSKPARTPCTISRLVYVLGNRHRYD
ncbi:MAG: hypothetical protein K2I87_08065 [Bacteroidales bacterium]|nr:hypothetical protein [Bacteroidales bacterium]